MIKCSTCKIEKDISEFHNTKKLKSGYSVRCKICANKATKDTYHKNDGKIKSRIYRTNNPDAGRDARFKYKYGISLEEYNDLLSKQDNKCAICKVDSEDRHLDVDHSHDTGKIRGLLCRMCNVALGHMKDSVEIIQNAIVYLEAK